MEQRITIDSTQSVVGYPRLAAEDLVQGVPSSITCKVWTPATTPTDFVAASVDSLSGTLSAAAAAGATSLALTGSVSAVKGRLYLLVDGGRAIVVEAAVTESSSTFRLAHPLSMAVASGSLLKGWAVTKALTSAQTAQPGPCSILWVATVDSKEVRWSQSFRVVSRLPRMTLTPAALTGAYGSVLSATPPSDPDLERAIFGAWQMEVVPLLEARDVLSEEVTSAEALEALHAIETMRALYCFDPRIDEVFRERLDKQRDERIARTFKRRTFATRDQLEDPTPLVPGGERDLSRRRLLL